MVVLIPRGLCVFIMTACCITALEASSEADKQVIKKRNTENELELLSLPLQQKKNIKSSKESGKEDDDIESELNYFTQQTNPKPKIQTPERSHVSKQKMAQFSQMFLQMMNALTADEEKSLSVSLLPNKNMNQKEYQEIKEEYKKRSYDTPLQAQGKPESHHEGSMSRNEVKHYKGLKNDKTRNHRSHESSKMLRMKRSLYALAKETSMSKSSRRSKRDINFTPEEIAAVRSILEHSTNEDVEDEYSRPRRDADDDEDEGSDLEYQNQEPDEDGDDEEMPIVTDDEIRDLEDNLENSIEAEERGPVALAETNGQEPPTVMFEVTFGGQLGFFVPADQKLGLQVAEMIEKDVEQKKEDVEELRYLASRLSRLEPEEDNDDNSEERKRK